MKHKPTHRILYIIQAVLLVAVLYFGYQIYQDTRKIKEEFIRKQSELAKNINSLDKQLKKEFIKSDSLYKPNLLYLNESIIDLKEKNADFRIEKEKQIEELYLERMKYLIYFVALIATIFVIMGLEWKISKKVDDRVEEVIADKIEERKELIGQIVDEKGWEFRLMAKAHIMVVNPNKKDDAKNLNPVLKFFEEKGAEVSDFSIKFDKPDKIIQEVNKRFDTERLNIVLLENSDGNWNLKNKTNELNAAIIAKGINKKAMLVYFGPGNAGFFPSRPENYYPLYDDKYSNFKIQEKTLSDKKDKISEEEKTKLEEIREKIKKIVDDIRKKHIDEINSIIDTISFANTPSKLYPNLIDALKYLDIIDPDIDA